MVPYYRQLLSVLNLFLTKRTNIGDAIDYRYVGLGGRTHGHMKHSRAGRSPIASCRARALPLSYALAAAPPPRPRRAMPPPLGRTRRASPPPPDPASPSANTRAVSSRATTCRPRSWRRSRCWRRTAARTRSSTSNTWCPRTNHADELCHNPPVPPQVASLHAAAAAGEGCHGRGWRGAVDEARGDAGCAGRAGGASPARARPRRPRQLGARRDRDVP